MLQLQQRPITFPLLIIPTLPEQDFIKITHINVRGYLDHIDDLKADYVISCADIIRWFKCKLKPPNRITHDKLQLAIWDTSFWTFWLKFGHKGP